MRKQNYLLFIILYFGIITSTSAQWIQIGSDIDGEASGDFSGQSVSLSSDGSIVAIGAILNDGNGSNSGHVRIYKNISGTWTQIGNDIDGEASQDKSGHYVSLNSDGLVVAIGTQFNDEAGDNAGHVRIFKNQSDTWTQIGNDIDGKAIDERAGSSVCLNADGSIVAVGASNPNEMGNVRIYENQSGIWSQIGSDIVGYATGDYFGSSVSLSSDGSVVAIGAPGNDANGESSGHVKIFENQSGTWVQLGNDINGEASNDYSGVMLSLNSDGSVIAIAAKHNDDAGLDAGHVRVYKYQEDAWTQIGDDIDGEAADDYFGSSVSLCSDGSVLAIGASQNDGNGDKSGHVRVFKNLFGKWCQIGNNINGEAADDYFGYSVNLSSDGSIVAIGAVLNDGNGDVSGHVRVFNNCNSFSEINPIVCNSYIVPSGTYTYTSSGVYYDTIPNAMGCDSIVAINLTVLRNEVTDTKTACDSYTWIDGNTYTSNNNTATYKLTNIHGCDSVVTLNLTINYVDVSVTEVGIVLEANEISATYQWIDCNDNNNPITGETSQSFIATENGSYAVIVDNGLCADTSICYTITGVGIMEIENTSIKIYPNPTIGIIKIDLAEDKVQKISITDMSGKKIIERIPDSNCEKIDLSNFESGLYIIMFETDKEIYTSKILKE